ncbi:MAG TPA: hypothetical protein VIN61_15860 [Gammaproteobacteria bacterium]
MSIVDFRSIAHGVRVIAGTAAGVVALAQPSLGNPPQPRPEATLGFAALPVTT